MNIIITLPIELVAEIAEGRKQVEIRRNIPISFNTHQEVVWVKAKGSDKVPLCFEVSHFEEDNDTNAVWLRYGKQIGVLYAWYQKYVRNARKVAIWHIKRVHIFMPNLTFSKTFGGIKAPQSYVYTDVRLESVMIQVEKTYCYVIDGKTFRKVPREKAVQ